MKKQLIMEKARELFAKQGFEATSVQQITDLCGISKGAFYLSFKSKDELILALVDQYMMQFTTDTDYLVNNSPDESVLYDFYYKTAKSFHQHSDFAKILMKEQTQSFNNEFIGKMRYYDRLFEDIILSIIERIYGDAVQYTKYDLVYCIKGFISTYAGLFLFSNVPVNLELLAESLVEKTDLLAKHTTIPFVSKEMHELSKQFTNEEISKDQLLDLIEQKIQEVHEAIEKESLVLIKQHIIDPSLSPAIVRGLLENIHHNPECKWIAYLLRRHLNL